MGILRTIFCCRCCCKSEDSDGSSNQPNSTQASKDNPAFDSKPPPVQYNRYTPNPVQLRTSPSGQEGTHIALYDYIPRMPGDISFRKGEHLVVLDRTENADWWKLKSLKTFQQGYGPTNYIARLNTPHQEEWYVGKIGRPEANRRLLADGNGRGTFLIRESERFQGNFALSVRDDDPGERKRVRHYHIRKTDDGRFYVSATAQFHSLNDLVLHYKRMSDGLACKLTNSCAVHDAPLTGSIARDLFEVDRKWLTKTEKIGSGAFGEVYKGLWNNTTEVAIKQLIPGKMSAIDFLKEAEVMKKFRHDNVVRLLAVVSEEPIFIITEFMPNGSLLDYLRHGEGKYTEIGEHLDMAGQIAAGMAHLEAMNYIHRDLRAANVLVGKRGICKVADFGLARLMVDDEYQAGEGTKFPFKWAAPEALTHHLFSIKSDVWSFGILMGEIVTRGAVPYPAMRNDEVAVQVEAGYRMPKPNGCNDDVYEVMTRCWRHDPENRPSFKQLQDIFENFTKDYADVEDIPE